jgi:hypothetical protein
MPVEFYPLTNSPLRARRLFLFLLVLFPLFLFGFRLLALRRRRGPGFRWRRALLLALARRRCLRPRSGLVPVRLGLTGYRTSGFGTVIRLCRRRAVIAHRWLSGASRLGTRWLRLIAWLTWPVRCWRGRRTIRLRPIIWCGLIRLRRRRPIRLCRWRTIVSCRWLGWTGHLRLIAWLCRCGLIGLR